MTCHWITTGTTHSKRRHWCTQWNGSQSNVSLKNNITTQEENSGENLVRISNPILEHFSPDQVSFIPSYFVLTFKGYKALYCKGIVRCQLIHQQSTQAEGGKRKTKTKRKYMCVCVCSLLRGVLWRAPDTTGLSLQDYRSYCDSVINITHTPSLTHAQIITHQESHHGRTHSKSFKLNSHLFSISRYVPVCILHHISIKQHKGKHLITDAFKETHSINAQTIDTVCHLQ